MVVEEIVEIESYCRRWESMDCSGQHLLFWFDAWHPLGVLKEKFSPQMLALLRIPLNAKVSTFIKYGSWNWPSGRNRRGEVLQLFTATPS